mmetsp:Transcript_17448/g.20933  ORF Transcript_17448/g.20933 Transcript_17448/m.20933 type:complete len:231 (-) Transcript_17448:363-1055(-)|eukprot:CAMPEP_0197849664 /NCGR_PEP_ID=MMETSP1438-20131217/12825_1 /TAXON_ID=1461541 /ORGANISM="Pterosperma sp., Strain CCMP1384" /LENGTH=230 /DNA_ID=CAMNT_0043462447 /DNA_START=182 /DNA_END=874 /DNA_ORIENTATION=-
MDSILKELRLEKYLPDLINVGIAVPQDVLDCHWNDVEACCTDIGMLRMEVARLKKWSDTTATKQSLLNPVVLGSNIRRTLSDEEEAWLTAFHLKCSETGGDHVWEDKSMQLSDDMYGTMPMCSKCKRWAHNGSNTSNRDSVRETMERYEREEVEAERTKVVEAERRTQEQEKMDNFLAVCEVTGGDHVWETSDFRISCEDYVDRDLCKNCKRWRHSGEMHELWARGVNKF